MCLANPDGLMGAEKSDTLLLAVAPQPPETKTKARLNGSKVSDLHFRAGLESIAEDLPAAVGAPGTRQ